MHCAFSIPIARRLSAALAAMVVTALTGCAGSGAGTSATTPVNIDARPSTMTADTPALLTAYRWRLVAATASNGQALADLAPRLDRPLRLSFEAGRLGASGGCNRMGGSYTLAPGGQLNVSGLMGTRMACEPALMRLDAALGRFLAGPLQWAIGAAGRDAAAAATAPRLVLTAADRSQLVFAGEATAETRYGGTPEIIFLEVAPTRVACAQPLMPGTTCLQVRERHYDANGLAIGTPGAWHPLYGEIEGFVPEAGMRQVLRLKRFQRAGALPADRPSTALVLDMVIETERVGR